MAEAETRDDLWGDKIARVTFLVIVVGVVLFAAAVFFFIL
jgi:hypothetical protein